MKTTHYFLYTKFTFSTRFSSLSGQINFYYKFCTFTPKSSNQNTAYIGYHILIGQNLSASTRLIFKIFQTSKACNTWQCNSVYTLNFWFALISWPELYIWCTIRKYWDILTNPVLVYSPNTLHYTYV